MGHRSKTKSIKAKAPSSSKRVPAHHVAKSYHVPESATEIPKDSVNRRIVFRFDCVDGFLACKPGISMPGLHAFSYC